LAKAALEIRKEKWALEKAGMEKKRVAAAIAAQPKPLKAGLEQVILNESELEILESIRTIVMLEGVSGERKGEFREKEVKKIVAGMTSQREPVTGTNKAEAEKGNKRRGAKDAEKTP